MPFRNRRRIGDAAMHDPGGIVRGLLFFAGMVVLVAAAAVLPVILQH